MGTHYDQSTGVLSDWDERNMTITARSVRYLDRNVPPNGLPQYPDAKFLLEFARAFIAALGIVNRNADRKMVFDDARLNGFPGHGFREGELNFFVVREDKAGVAEGATIHQFSDADYRYEARDRDSVAAFNTGGQPGLIKMFVEGMGKIQDKK